MISSMKIILAWFKLAQMDVCLRRAFSVCSQKPFGCLLYCVHLIHVQKSQNVKVLHCATCLHTASSFGQKSLLDNLSHICGTGITWQGGCQMICHSSESTPKQKGRTVVRSDQYSFNEKENEYFHLYLEISSNYKPYLLSSVACSHAAAELSKQDFEEMMEEARDGKIDALLHVFEHWSVKAKRGHNVPADKNFSDVVRLSQKLVSKMSVQQLIESMAYLSRLGFRDSDFSYADPRKNRILLSKTFDKVCCKKIKEFEVKDLLFAADFFYAMRGSAFTEYPYLMCEKLKRHVSNMTKNELLLLLFHIGLARRSLPGLTEDILNQLEPEMSSLSLQELGIVNLAHYKTQTNLRQPSFFKALTDQLKRGAGSDLDPIGLSAVFKYQQKSLNRKKDIFVPQFFTMVREMEEPLLGRIPSLPSETLMHMLNLYYSLDLLSEDLFMAVLKRIASQGLKDWRVKDIARVAHVVTNIPLGKESRMEAIAEILSELRKLERLAERQSFLGCMLQLAVAMTVCSVYPHWLAQEIFSDASQSNFRGSDIDWSRDLYHLSESILIEDGTYQGPLLWPENFPKLSKSKVHGRLKEMSARGTVGKEMVSSRDWTLLDLMDTIRDINPQLQVQPVFLLSHFQTADIEVMPGDAHESQNGRSKKRASSLLEPADTAVVLHASNAYQKIRCQDGKTIQLLRQYHAMRARQLRKLGTTVVEVSSADLQKTPDKSQYLKCRFGEANALDKSE